MLVQNESITWFRKLVDSFLADRTSLKPPTVADFREALKRHRQSRFDREVVKSVGSWESMKTQCSDDGLKKYFESIGAKNLTEAMQKAKECDYAL